VSISALHFYRDLGYSWEYIAEYLRFNSPEDAEWSARRAAEILGQPLDGEGSE
jgi:hypothetical protein